MAKLLGAFVVVDLYFFGCDLLTARLPRRARAPTVVGMLVSGPLAPFFWTEVVGCALAAVVCFVPRLRTNPLAGGRVACSPSWASSASACSCLVGGFQIPNLDYARRRDASDTVTSWEAGMAGAYQGMVYWPAPIEWGVALGVVGLGVLLLCLGLKYLPLRPAGDEA